jgi:hypothetical protein
MKCLNTEAHWGLIWPFARKTVLQVVKDSLHRIYTYHLVMTQAEQENTSSHYIRDDTSASLAHNGVSSGISNHALERAYCQNTRQRTRAGLGTVISTGLAGSGFYNMAAPALVAGYGLNKSLQTKKQIEQLMQ